MCGLVFRNQCPQPCVSFDPIPNRVLGRSMSLERSPRRLRAQKEAEPPRSGAPRSSRGSSPWRRRAPARSATPETKGSATEGREKHGHGSKFNYQGTAGVSPWFHLPGFYFGYRQLIIETSYRKFRKLATYPPKSGSSYRN